MINDYELLLANGVDISLAVGTHDISEETNGKEYDRGPLATGNISAVGAGDFGGLGAGHPLFFWWSLTGALVDSAGDAATLEVFLVSDDTSLGFDANSHIHYRSGVITQARANVLMGTAVPPTTKQLFPIVAPLPSRTVAGNSQQAGFGWLRYVGILLVVAGADITTATLLTGGITATPDVLPRIHDSGLVFHTP